MTPEACPRSWEVEAARDGRLDAVALDSHRSHLAHCRTCQRELADLTAYLHEMSALGGAADEVRLRRLRQAVLAAWNRQVMEPAQRRWPWMATAALALAGGLIFTWHGSSAPEVPDPITIVAQSDAHWQRSRRTDEERISLSAGTLRLHVDHTHAARRLIVVVPDGEIEDVGTTFRVSVDRGRTVAVEVTEGRVVFRRQGEADLHLIAGSEWSPPAEPVVAAPAPSTESEPAVAPVEVPRAHHRSGAHATSRSTEDIAYLRVINLVRGGRRQEARQAALAYLAAYPRGFRRPEVQRFVDDVDASAR